jgi:hypothetical protein
LILEKSKIFMNPEERKNAGYMKEENRPEDGT